MKRNLRLLSLRTYKLSNTVKYIEQDNDDRLTPLYTLLDLDIINMCVYVRVYVYIRVCTSVCVYMCIYVGVYVCVYVYLCMFVIYVYIYK